VGADADGWQPFGGAMAPLGRLAWLRIGGPGDDAAIDIVVNDHRMQSFHPDCFAPPASTRCARGCWS
jgi:microcystin degradation protein MlrC